MILTRVLLIVVFLGSAVGVVYNQYQARTLFIEMQRLKVSLDRYETEWGQLQLELMTLSEHSRIEGQAYSRLNLVTPKYNEIIYIKQ
ncbi:MAG TPA: cell division protein FtsL [Methylococcaceae bacterium]|jgi:cell division protein FtsL|nr:cell division protein FtsL [Methylococcaceae bacterium]HIA44793.1 cell division protein FtsL [Methylococcaceae bacterium]HIN69477.1 cell division protein FtsL [Methylococcales bacterium]HIO44648.1 cell division protein FtsL [Methylococcales bacterium]